MLHVAAESSVADLASDGAAISSAVLPRASADPLRVLFLNTREDIGADVSVHLSLLRHFDRRLVRPTLLTNSQAIDADVMRDTLDSVMADLDARFVPLGTPGWQMARLNARNKIAQATRLMGSLLSAASIIRRERIGVIHATDRPRDAFFATLLGRMTGAASVVHMHCNCGDYLSPQTLYGLRNATAVFAVSDYIRRELIKLPGIAPERVHVLHNAVDADRFYPSDYGPEIRHEVRKAYGLLETDFVVGSVARLIDCKGQRESIEAVARLAPSLPGLRLLIVGEGPERARLEGIAREHGIAGRVIFAGRHSDVAPLLASMDLFALPSYEEPFGLAIAEAMAMQLPVIACNAGGVPEIIEHGVTGWLVKPRSSDAVADAIARLMADPERRRVLGDNARSRVARDFAPRAQADRAAQLYSATVRSRRSHS